MTYSAVVVGPERRRRFTEDQNLAILAAAFAPGASVAEVARQADVCSSVIYRWRRSYMAVERPAGLAPEGYAACGRRQRLLRGSRIRYRVGHCPRGGNPIS